VKNTFTTTTLSQSDLTYNSLGQIQTVKQSGTAFNDYYLDPADPAKNFVTNSFGYDAMGQLQTKAMYSPVTSTAELPGRRFEYRYDSMGNRLTAGETAADVANGGIADDYVTNALNQYGSVTNNTVRVLGTVGPNAAIKVAVAGAPSTTKTDRSWGADIVPTQGAAAASGTATVYAAIPGTPDVIRTDATKSWFSPPALQSFKYDADGNLTSDGVWTYAYDAENRLISMTNLLPPGAGHKRWSLFFQYDYLGRRVQKSATNLDNGALSYTRRYVYNGWNLVAEYDSSGTALKRSYTWGLDLAGSFDATGGVGALMQITDHTANRNYFAAYDHNGNVAALERDDGVLAAAYEYGPFGEPLRAETSPADTTMADNPFRFSTKFTDVETGLVNYGQRCYSPTLGRFINRDPVEESGGLNLYGFCGNNGISHWDYLGMDDPTNNSDNNEHHAHLVIDEDGNIMFVASLVYSKERSDKAAANRKAQEDRESSERSAAAVKSYQDQQLMDAVNASMSIELNNSGALSQAFGNGYQQNQRMQTMPASNNGLTAGEFLSAAGSGAAQGLYNVTIGAAKSAFNSGVDHMAASAMAFGEGDYTMGLLHATAMAGDVAGLALTAVGAGELTVAGGKMAVGAFTEIAENGIGSFARDAARNTGRFFYDNRAFPKVSREYWASNGPADGSSLHHWLFPQRASWIPQGIRNAGFNLMELPPIINTPFGGLNQWMGMSGSLWAPVIENGIRLAVPASMGGAAYGGAQLGSGALAKP